MTVLWYALSPVSHFTGRTEAITQMKTFFEKPVTSPKDARHRIQVVRGMGGIGKSQTALMYAEQLKGEYSAGIYADATDNKSILLSFSLIAANLASSSMEVTRSYNPTPQRVNAVETVKQWLARRPSKWLMIFDNHDKPGKTELAYYLPREGNGDIIVTSRQME